MKRIVSLLYLIALLSIFLFVIVRIDESAAPSMEQIPDTIAQTSIPTSTPSPTPTQAPLPIRLVIPKLNVDTIIESKSADDLGNMEMPEWSKVAWYSLGPRPGDQGAAVIAGHYDTNTGAPSMFYRLTDLEPGDNLYVIGDTGAINTFMVTDKRIYAYGNVPLDEIFNDAAGHKLNLITCGGVWNPVMHTYSDRLVVYTSLQ